MWDGRGHVYTDIVMGHNLGHAVWEEREECKVCSEVTPATVLQAWVSRTLAGGGGGG